MKTQYSVQLIGYLGADPILRKSVKGCLYTKVRVATDYFRRQPDGTVSKIATWHTIMVWDTLAESIGETFIRGSHVMIQGHIRNETFTGRDGNKVFYSYVLASKVVDLDR